MAEVTLPGCPQTVPSLSCQLLTAIAHDDWTPGVIWLTGTQSYVMMAGHSASLCQAHNWDPRADFYYCQTVAGLMMWGTLSDRMGLSFTIAAGPHQWSHSLVSVPWDSWSYFTNLRLTQPERPGALTHIPREQGGPVIPAGTGIPLCCFLPLTGLWWRYLNPHPCGELTLTATYNLSCLQISAQTMQKSPFLCCRATASFVFVCRAVT
jgi:hypothetical protein